MFPKATFYLFRLYYYSWCPVLCGGRRASAVFHNRADNSFIFYGTTKPILVYLKIEYRLSRYLWGGGGDGGEGRAYAASLTTLLYMKT